VSNRYLFIAEDIYFGREIFSLAIRSNCTIPPRVVFCNATYCNIVNNGTGPVVFVGDISIPNLYVPPSSTIEGNVFTNGDLRLGNGTTVLGTIIITGDGSLHVDSSTTISTRGCIDSQGGTLVVTVTPEELESGRIDFLNGQCINGPYTIRVISADECNNVTVNTDSVEQTSTGLSVSFSNENICDFDPLVVGLSTAGAVVAASILIIITVLCVKPLRNKILPNRGRDHMKKTQTSKSRRVKEKIPKRKSDETSPA